MSIFEGRVQRFVTSDVVNHVKRQRASRAPLEHHGEHGKLWEADRFERDMDGV